MFIQKGIIAGKNSANTYTVNCPALSTSGNIVCDILGLPDTTVVYTEGQVVAVAEFGMKEWIILGELSSGLQSTSNLLLSTFNIFTLTMTKKVDTLSTRVQSLSAELSQSKDTIDKLEMTVAVLKNIVGGVI